MTLSKLLAALVIPVFSMCAYAASAAPDAEKPAQVNPAAQKLEPIPADKDEDLRVFYPDGKVVKGEAALELMQAGKTGFNIWLAGNQFFAMEEVIHAFQKQHKDVVGVVTMPPGKVMNAVLKGGWVYKDKDYAMTPDVFGMVDMGSMKNSRKPARARIM